MHTSIIFYYSVFMSLKFSKYYYLFTGLILAFSQSEIRAQSNISQDSMRVRKVIKTTEGEEQNRNVMLNAANNNGPREVNIGLPSNVGGTTIMENDLPVVYYFWPELPSRTWRSSVSLSRSGLQGLREQSVLMGDFGYAVNSYTKLGGDSLEIAGNLSASHFGWIKADVNVSAPLGNGWSYSAGAFLNFDPMTYNPGFTRYSDETQIYRAGITKRFKNGRGKVSLLYKYTNSAALPTNYAAFRYLPGGAIEKLDNFRLGRDSYFLGSGLINFRNSFTNEPYQVDLSNRKDKTSTSHTFDVLGNYELKNDWNFKYVVRYHHADPVTNSMAPVGIRQVTAAEGYTYKDNGTPYEGFVQTIVAAHYPSIPVNSIMSRFEINKQTSGHNWRVGVTESYHNVKNYYTDRSFFFQEVANQPRQLRSPITDEAGFYNYNSGVEHHNGFENKLTAYLSDTWKISDKLSLGYGTNLRYHKLKGDFYEQPRGADFTFAGLPRSEFDYNWFHLGATANLVYKITDQFGVTGDFIYTEKHGQLEDFSGGYIPTYKKTKSPYAGLGVYFNSPKISIVSALTYLTRNNYVTRLNLVNPTNATEAEAVYTQYDIKTTGWTTDIVAKPFNGFSLHYLITFQNPIYQNYDFSAFTNAYSFTGNNVLGISKVLMEIDPSYSVGKFKIWGSARYFSKQFANLTNQLNFKGWWETFAGANYQLNKQVGLGLTVVNIFGQNGAKGTINGAELITDPSPFYNSVLTSSYIRPFTVEASVNFKF